MNRNPDCAALSVKALTFFCISDLADDLTGNVLIVNRRLCCDLHENMHLICCTGNFASHMRLRIL